jgi:hypothetical protein
LTIPIGIFDVTDVATILTDYYGAANANNAEIFFNFGTGSTVSEVVGVKLQNANTSGSAASGQIGSSTTCLTNPLPVPCSGLAGGALAPSTVLTAFTLSTATANNSAVFSTGTTGNITVDATYAYGPVAYTSVGSSREFNGTTGQQQLDAQDFIFGSAYQNLTLISMGIADPNFLAPPVGGSAAASVLSLTAITVDPASAPEPSTWVLFFSGLVLVGFARRQRKRSIN